MVDDLYVNYTKNQQDFFTDLPAEIQELLLDSKKQAQEGKTRSHKEVMAYFRKKYAIPK